MSTMMNPILDTELWFRAAVPEPTNKNVNVQLGCHIEEVAEMLEELQSLDDEIVNKYISDALIALIKLSSVLKTTEATVTAHDPVDLLDSLLDQIVTATGIGYMLGMDVPSGLAEVNNSNYSKFVDDCPIFDSNGKIMKGPGYYKPYLKLFV